MDECSTSRRVDRILVVGLGSMGRRYIEVIRELNKKILIGALGIRKGQAQLNIQGVDQVFTSIEEALHFHPDVAIICGPATTHIDIGMQCAKAGVHLFVEKPLSNALHGVCTLIQTCEHHNVKLMVGYNLRFSSSLNALKTYLIQGAIGKAYSVRAQVGQYLPEWRVGIDYRTSVSARKDLGGGVLLELSHDIDYLMWIFGEIGWVTSHVSRQSSLDIDVEDSAHVIMGFHEESENPGLVVSLSMDCFRRDHTRDCVVVGKEGTLRWNGVSGEVDMFSPRGVRGGEWMQLYKEGNDKTHLYNNEIAHFIKCVELNETPCVDGYVGLAVLSVLEAIRESNKTGERIYPPYGVS